MHKKSQMLLLAMRKNNTGVETRKCLKKMSFRYFVAMLMNKLFVNLRSALLTWNGEGSKSELISEMHYYHEGIFSVCKC